MRARLCLVAVALAACGDGGGGGGERPPKVDPCDARSDPGPVVAVQTLLFTRREGDRSEGFDLDGADATCGVADLVDASGNGSIDNGFSGLLPALELTEAAAVEDLVQQTIAGGELVITFELRDLDVPASGPLTDRCVDLVVGRATGVPMLGTDGKLLDGQTLDADPDTVPIVIEDVPVVDGHFEAPFEISLPLQIFDVAFDFVLTDGRIAGDVAPDGTVTGRFAGAAEVSDLLEVAGSGNIDAALDEILATLLGQWADLSPDGTGECTQISVGFDYVAVPIFLYE